MPDFTDAIRAMANGSPEQRAALQRATETAVALSSLKHSGLTFAEVDGHWTLTGTPSQWVSYLESLRGD